MKDTAYYTSWFMRIGFADRRRKVKPAGNGNLRVTDLNYHVAYYEETVRIYQEVFSYEVGDPENGDHDYRLLKSVGSKLFPQISDLKHAAGILGMNVEIENIAYRDNYGLPDAPYCGSACPHHFGEIVVTEHFQSSVYKHNPKYSINHTYRKPGP